METIKPTLVILAAGMGSRFGGIKQIAPVDDAGHIIIDYSIYDAYRAGFKDIICIINPNMEKEFTEHFKDAASQINIRFAYQTLDNLPTGYEIPTERVKPWGTAHALLCAMPQINGPFAVVNADDFYGRSSFELAYNFLTTKVNDNHHAMLGYQIENTLTESGHVSRGVCTVENGYLTAIEEILQIWPAPNGAKYTTNGTDFTFLPEGTIVSMSMWGFGYGLLTEIKGRFETFLKNNITEDPLKCEYRLPEVVGDLLVGKKATVEIIPTTDKWYGVTYAEDMPGVRKALEQMKESGVYPKHLWEK